MQEKKVHKIENPINTAEHAVHHEREIKHEKHSHKTHEIPHEKQEKNLEEIRRAVEESAQTSEQLRKEEFKDLEKETSQVFVQKELKKITLKKTIAKVQNELPPTERAFSKIVHAPVVDKLSSVGEKTIARPVGILGGGLLAFSGSLLSTYFARRFGMSYNIFMFVIFFATGYLVSTLLELLYRSVFQSKNNS